MRSCRRPVSCVNKMCGMIKLGAIISGANPISIDGGRACGHGLQPRREPARSRTPANVNKHRPASEAPRQRDADVGFTKWTMLKRRGSDGGALSTPGATMGICSVVTCGRRPILEFQMKKPAASFPARARILQRWIDAHDLPTVSTFPKVPSAPRYRHA